MTLGSKESQALMDIDWCGVFERRIHFLLHIPQILQVHVIPYVNAPP